MVNLEQLRAALAAGPPAAPDKNSPGPFRRAFLAMLAAHRETGDPEPSPQELVEMLAHLFDRNAWRAAMAEYEQCKAIVEQAEKRVLPAGTLPFPPRRPQ